MSLSHRMTASSAKQTIVLANINDCSAGRSRHPVGMEDRPLPARCGPWWLSAIIIRKYLISGTKEGLGLSGSTDPRADARDWGALTA